MEENQMGDHKKKRRRKKKKEERRKTKKKKRRKEEEERSLKSQRIDEKKVIKVRRYLSLSPYQEIWRSLLWGVTGEGGGGFSGKSKAKKGGKRK